MLRSGDCWAVPDVQPENPANDKGCLLMALFSVRSERQLLRSVLDTTMTLQVVSET